MNPNAPKKSSFSVSLSNLFRLGIFETIYAKSQSGPSSEEPPSRPNSPPRTPPSPCPVVFAQDRFGAGDAPSIKPERRRASESSRTTSDRGKTGAGVTGSRVGGRLGDQPQGPSDLPRGAINPGLLRYIHNAARYRLPQCFEGGIVSVKQSSKSNWMLGHSLSFSSVSPGGYKLLLSYIDTDRPGTPPYFVMEAAPGGQLSFEVRVGPTKGTRATLVAQMADAELYSFESVFDMYFQSITASIIAVNREFIALHFLQAVTNQLSLGGELVARGSAWDVTSASAAGRWANANNSLSATVGNRGLDVCYARNIKPFLTIATMLEVGFAVRRAVGTLAYEWRSDLWTARASLDSDGLVGATLQRALGGKNAHLSCAISALLNHPNDKFRLGFALNAAII